MRRRGLIILIVLLIGAAIYGTYRFAYNMGDSDGRQAVAADRSEFQTRIASNPVNVPSGSNAAGGRGTGQPGAAGAPGGNTGSGAGGGPSTGRAGTPAAGSPVAGTAGTPGSGRNIGVASNLTGRVTKIDGTTLSLLQSDNATVSVATNTDTAVRKLVTGALTDLKSGDVVMVDGSKTGDTAYMAKTITSLASPTGSGGSGQRPPGAQGSPAASGGAVIGQIKSLDGATMMLQLGDGATVTVTTNASTVIRTQQPGALSDIKMGDFLVVQGEKTSDTAYLARSITNQGAASPG